LIEVAYLSYYEVLHEDDYKLQDDMNDPIAFLSRTSDPDMMYFHEAIRQPDREDFIKAIIKEVNDHIKRKHWILVPREDVPKGTKILLKNIQKVCVTQTTEPISSISIH
jgi:hypothetical protein